MIVEDENLLKAWIARDVESSTDADADALAKYVIALIKKPLSDTELEKLCLDKLFVFLQSNTKSFVDRLFRCLNQGLYLPASTRSIPSPPGVDDDAGDDHIILDAHGSDDEDNGAPEKPEEKKEKREEKRSGETSARDAKEKPKSSPSKAGSTSATARPQRRRISPPPSSTSAVESTKDRDSSLATKDQRPSEQRRKAISPPVRESRGSRRGASGYSSGGDRSGRSGRSERYHRRARSRERSWSRSRSRSRSASRSRSPHRSEYEPTLRRRRCRDFHEKGYCTRGDKCAYDHGPDPVVIDNNAFDAIVSRSAPPPTISAHPLTSTAMGVPGYNPINPPPPGLETKSVFGTSPSTEPYNPEAPALTTSSALATKMDFSVPPPPLPSLPYSAPPPAAPLSYGSTPAASTTGLVTVVGGPTPYNPAQSTRIAQDSMVTSTAGSGFGSNFSGYTSQSQSNMSSGPPTSFSSRGRGMRGSRFKPYGVQSRINPALCSLLVKKIPPEQNKIVMLDQHFGKFGQITNLHVQYQGQPDTALVTFKTRRDAMNAMRSTEPIFNNRFIKVFWQTETDQLTGAAGEGAQGLETSSAGLQESGSDAAAAPPIPTDLNRAFSKTFGAEHQPEEPTQAQEEPKPAEQKPAATEPSQPRAPAGIQTHLSRPIYNPRSIAAKRKSEKDSLLKMVELQKKKTEVYAKLVENQKDLAQKIQSTDNEDVKKKYKELFKKLDHSTKTTKEELEKLRDSIIELQKKLQEYAKRPFGQISNAPKATNGNEHGSGSPTSEPNEKLTKNVSSLQLNSTANNKKLFRVVHVTGCPIELNEDLIVHMEKFGELFDFDIAPRNRNAPCVFTYKNAIDAQRAVTEASKFAAGEKLKVEWAPVSLGQQPVVIPDKERDPTEQVQAAQLLANLDDDEDDELSDNEHNGNSHQEEALEEDE
ncbi:PWI domain-containing protein [Ditylenchus destructor]|uniref:PWI domain-containing protein n=1 Tax=Ditylenchus destructor TaxID=166010 RepID=A0AAD4N3I3_9BILA|nr:PWI domain-containing protein [Ditylenchus destructor]